MTAPLSLDCVVHSVTSSRHLISMCIPARYVCEHLNNMPMSAMSRVLDTHDLLCSIVPVLENPPWTRRLPLSGQWQKRDGDGQKWNDVANADLLTLTKIEGQVWIALFSLVCNAEVRSYHLCANVISQKLCR